MHLVKKIKLDNNQIKQLINDNSVYLEHNTILQFVDDDLVLNKNGEIYCTSDISMEFKKCKIENEFIISDIKQLVCEHLNLQPNEVIYQFGGASYYEFSVRFNAKCEWKIFVCDYGTAVKNTNDMFDDVKPFKFDEDFIGLYKRLGNSPYYFRWFNDI